jgi:hypothetical protein
MAYCIEPVTSRTQVRACSAARLAMRLIDGGTFTDAEAAVLRLQMLLGYATPESPEARTYGDQLNEAWDQLTPSEREHLSG